MVIIKNALVGIFLILVFIGCSSKDHEYKDRVRAILKRLTYLQQEIPEVQAIRMDGYDVYVEFKNYVNDLPQVVNAAAIWASKAGGGHYRYRVWAIKTGCSDPTTCPYYCYASPSYGQHTSETCGEWETKLKERSAK